MTIWFIEINIHTILHISNNLPISLKNIVSNKSDTQIDSFGNVITTKTIEFRTIKDKGSDGDQPHFGGYLSSGHPSDPHFTLKGWFNEDGQIRIELVK